MKVTGCYCTRLSSPWTTEFIVVFTQPKHYYCENMDNVLRLLSLSRSLLFNLYTPSPLPLLPTHTPCTYNFRRISWDGFSLSFTSLLTLAVSSPLCSHQYSEVSSECVCIGWTITTSSGWRLVFGRRNTK